MSSFTHLGSHLPKIMDPRLKNRSTGQSGTGSPANAPAPPSRQPMPEQLLPRWYRRGIGFRLPRGHRAKCPDCNGLGSSAYQGFIAECGFCLSGQGPCMQHKCRRCDGSGIVCPRCNGMRFYRVSARMGSEAQRCDACCEGNQVNPARERREIERYLARHQESADTVALETTA